MFSFFRFKHEGRWMCSPARTTIGIPLLHARGECQGGLGVCIPGAPQRLYSHYSPGPLSESRGIVASGDVPRKKLQISELLRTPRRRNIHDTCTTDSETTRPFERTTPGTAPSAHRPFSRSRTKDQPQQAQQSPLAAAAVVAVAVATRTVAPLSAAHSEALLRVFHPPTNPIAVPRSWHRQPSLPQELPHPCPCAPTRLSGRAHQHRRAARSLW
mmetsp:Transcript_16162/g.35073  ORF Transcript_16162/g.35073 Transcript_16162/m.35073 type:complete len:214 (-) Transcript_16162:758-1399(-)